MIIDAKTLELDQKKLIQHFKVKGRFKKFEVLENTACFVFWLNGRNVLYTPDQQIDSKGGDALLLKCGTYINDLLPVKSEVIELVVVHFYPEMLRNLFRNELPKTLVDLLTTPQVQILLEQNNLLEKYVDTLLGYFNHPEIIDGDLLRLKLKELILILSRSRRNQTLQQFLKGLFAPEQLSFQRIIEAHLFSNLSVSELAYLTHRSLATFKRDFQQLYQDSPARYIKHKRLEKACQLLQTTDMRICDIACECGFLNTAHFTRIFHDKYNQSPSVFRMSQTESILS